MPHDSSSAPFFRAYARTQVSTASMCLRRLSDCVYSVRSFQASSRVGMFFAPNSWRSVADGAHGVPLVRRFENSCRIRPTDSPFSQMQIMDRPSARHRSIVVALLILLFAITYL